ncbi:hypothetical protein GGS23DRAFT_584391 [Durotheca rogersii]|uniref:uncharacterized protein n=1 Tax=Durotheca rogersii TaxID=419775 RepID=UPI00221ED47D|nr:uncharacterized protein GGS23DRAFT_584391 [Durotheca rogersii]KAI5859633.1 hypothetical protein GGS23DRAFT_584391 [Durotheca rogersii]
MLSYGCPSSNSLIEPPPHPPASGDYFLTHGQNASDPAVTACCAPNSVHLIDYCYLWCEVPQSFANDSVNAAAFQLCVANHGGEATVVVEGRVATSNALRTAGIAGLLTAAILLSFLCLN